MNREYMIAMMARAIKEASADGNWSVNSATAALTAIEEAGMVVVPVEPDEVVIDAMHQAFRNTRRGGVGGMTIDNQFKMERGPEFAAYRAMIAARPALTEDKG